MSSTAPGLRRSFRGAGSRALAAICSAALCLTLSSPPCAGDERDPEDSPATETSGAPGARLELVGALDALLDSKVRKGPDERSRAFTLSKDARAPRQALYGYGAELDLRVLDWASVGVLAFETRLDGPRRGLHYEGLELGDRRFAGHERTETRLTLRYAEASLRYVWRADDQLRLWFGIGVAWTSWRLRFESARQHADTDLRALLAPAFSYELAARASEFATLYFTSSIAASPTRRFPSAVSRLRLGVRWHLGPHLELVTGLHLRNVFLGGAARELLSKRVRPGHRWRRARATWVGVDVGIALRI